ncbi:glycosyltransferase family 2 protein [Candidatus Uabimicrobium amorphum]|uniref:Capsular biosynthesis protein n=1 Tax=Uabimicrobium amorphum TaxID=2596890 RepID=A0A5S9IU98_UABAM|nr:glycosyltransferase family 2 protein [Candidatus Uabimicrobium amorphum]BBM87491.1 hypothetical protein UABAM_05903 [Candidatus Uabimicrobium amorphum]
MIVIPMAGTSSRFRQAGYEKPKYMLQAKNKSLFAHAISSFSNYYASEKFLFICRDTYNCENFIRAELNSIGLNATNLKICILNSETSGQAETVAIGLKKTTVATSEPITIFNIDTMRPNYKFPKEFRQKNVDGYIEVFCGSGHHWSFVKPVDKSASIGKAIYVTEKNRISDFCSTGLYYFKSVAFYLDLYSTIENVNPTHLQGGERYVAPLYNTAISSGANIYYKLIPKDDVIFFGTPEEYVSFTNS